MAQWNNDTHFVIARNEGINMFCRVNPNGSHTPLDYPAKMKAGDVAANIAKLYPKHTIGILSDTFGNHVKRIYGDVVWLKDSYGRN